MAKKLVELMILVVVFSFVGCATIFNNKKPRYPHRPGLPVK
jgi:hypothetical protein